MVYVAIYTGLRVSELAGLRCNDIAQISRSGIEIPGNQILLRSGAEAKPDLDYLRAQIRSNEIDEVVVSRGLRVDKKVTSIPRSGIGRRDGSSLE